MEEIKIKETIVTKKGLQPMMLPLVIAAILVLCFSLPTLIINASQTDLNLCSQEQSMNIMSVVYLLIGLLFLVFFLLIFLGKDKHSFLWAVFGLAFSSVSVVMSITSIAYNSTDTNDVETSRYLLIGEFCSLIIVFVIYGVFVGLVADNGNEFGKKKRKN